MADMDVKSYLKDKNKGSTSFDDEVKSLAKKARSMGASSIYDRNKGIGVDINESMGSSSNKPEDHPRWNRMDK